MRKTKEMNFREKSKNAFKIFPAFSILMMLFFFAARLQSATVTKSVSSAYALPCPANPSLTPW